MIDAILMGIALLAAKAVAGPGSAIVINSCDYDVQLSNTPSAGGGYNAINKVLSPGGSYSQVYTELTNGNGWSLKLAKTDNFISNVLQYEYTYHADGTIWYDLSEVNGNPWDANWEITATSGCTPRQAAYRYSTDDAYGMQSCADTASITVTLCSGTSGGGAPSSPSGAPSSPVASPSWGVGNKVVESPAVAVHKHKQPPTQEAPTPEAPAPAPAPTSVADAWNGPAVTVTNIAYETVTQVVTATAHPHKRHVHHPRHPHGLR